MVTQDLGLVWLAQTAVQPALVLRRINVLPAKQICIWQSRDVGTPVLRPTTQREKIGSANGVITPAKHVPETQSTSVQAASADSFSHQVLASGTVQLITSLTPTRELAISALTTVSPVSDLQITSVQGVRLTSVWKGMFVVLHVQMDSIVREGRTPIVNLADRNVLLVQALIVALYVKTTPSCSTVSV